MLGKYFRTTSIIQPNQITGLTAWWKADSLVLNDNDPVSAWADSSTSGFDLSAVTTARPTYKSTGGPNSKPSISFDGAANVLTRASVPILSLVSTNQCHIFIVQYQVGTKANNCSLNFNGITVPLLNTHLTFSNTLFWDFGNAGAGQGRISVAQPSGWDDSWRMVQLIRESPNSGTSRIRDQGSQLTSGAVTQAMTAATATLSVGGGNQFLQGLISEVIIYNVALSTTDRQSIEAYLNAKYAIF